MNLLEKFDAIEVKADDRISDTDRIFCEAHQRAYDDARTALIALEAQWQEIVANQEGLLTPVEQYSRTRYISADLDISTSQIIRQLEKNQNRFIDAIVSYFNHHYKVSVSGYDVEKVLLPAEPSRRDWSREELAEHHKAVQNLLLRYEDIVDQVLIQLNGRSFAERAVDELKEMCHKAAWNSYNKTASYEVKKSTLQLTSYACKYENWFGHEKWELQDGMKNILRGIAHFETGGFTFIPLGFSELLGYNNAETPLHDFTTCDKLKQIKMFKNGRVDVKFTSELFARQFAEEYLGLVF